MAEPMKPVCLLTGAGGLLGSAFCRTLAARFDIAAIYRARHPDTPSQLEWLRDPLDPSLRVPENDHPVFAIQQDLSHEDGPSRVVDLALAHFGRVDVLVNAAADVTFWGPLLDAERQEGLRLEEGDALVEALVRDGGGLDDAQEDRRRSVGRRVLGAHLLDRLHRGRHVLRDAEGEDLEVDAVDVLARRALRDAPHAVELGLEDEVVVRAVRPLTAALVALLMALSFALLLALAQKARLH